MKKFWDLSLDMSRSKDRTILHFPVDWIRVWGFYVILNSHAKLTLGLGEKNCAMLSFLDKDDNSAASSFLLHPERFSGRRLNTLRIK